MEEDLRRNVSSGRVWEASVGYSRAVRAGDHVFVAGTTAVDAHGDVMAPGDGYGQAVHCLQTIEAALHQVGASMKDVVRTRMFVTDIAQWEAIGRAHAEFFGDIRPAATLVAVRGLLSEDMIVEIEADAIVLGGR